MDWKDIYEEYLIDNTDFELYRFCLIDFDDVDAPVLLAISNTDKKDCSIVAIGIYKGTASPNYGYGELRYSEENNCVAIKSETEVRVIDFYQNSIYSSDNNFPWDTAKPIVSNDTRSYAEMLKALNN